MSVRVASSAGEAHDLRVSGFDAVSGELSLSYTPGCSSQDHNVIFGSLDVVSTHGYSGEQCSIGTSGAHDLFLPGSASYFVLVVAEDGSDLEGSYGLSNGTIARPAGTLCELVQ